MEKTKLKPSEVKGKNTQGFGNIDTPIEQSYISESEMQENMGATLSSKSNSPLLYRENPQSKLPNFIKGILRENASITENLYNSNASFNITEDSNNYFNEITKKNDTVKTPPTVSKDNDDITDFKKIISEIIDEKFKEYQDSALKGIRLKNGNITLIDNKGDIYKAKLEYSGKVKK